MCGIQGCPKPSKAKDMCDSHRSKQWRESHPNAASENSKKWRLLHPEASSESSKKWVEENRERKYSLVARRRQKSREGVSSEDIDIASEYRKAIKNDPCFYCGTRSGEFHIDHAVPISRGGLEVWNNLVRACANCNLSKHTMTAEEFIAALRR